MTNAKLPNLQELLPYWLVLNLNHITSLFHITLLKKVIFSLVAVFAGRLCLKIWNKLFRWYWMDSNILTRVWDGLQSMRLASSLRIWGQTCKFITTRRCCLHWRMLWMISRTHEFRLVLSFQQNFISHPSTCYCLFVASISLMWIKKCLCALHTEQHIVNKCAQLTHLNASKQIFI